MTRKRILIVEDEHLVAEQLRQTLTAEGYEIIGVAETAEEAIAHVGQARPDLAIMDIMLRGPLDGIDAAQRLQPLGVPVVYLTGYSDRDLIDRAQETQPLGYVMKPAKSHEIAAVVQLALARKEREAARLRAGAKPLPEVDEQSRIKVSGVTDYVIFTTGPDGVVSSWNSGAEIITGYRRGEILGQWFGILFTPEDREQRVPESELARARVDGAAEGSRWMLRRNGERYWSEGVVTAIFDERGTLSGYIKIARDATERKQLEDLLAQKEQRLRVALQAARTGTWFWDLRSNIDTIDESLRDLFGLRSQHDIRTIEDFYAILHPDDRALVQAAFEDTRNNGVHLEIEFRVIWPDGTERWLLDKGEVVHQDGKPAYMAGACVDITDRKLAEEALQRSEQRFRLFVNNIRDYALFQLDSNGLIASWNSGAEHVLGYTAEEIIGQPSDRLFVPEDVLAGQPERERREAISLGRAQDERWHLRKDGSRFWCSGVLTVMRDEQGRQTGFAKVMRDETERRITSERLRASLSEKEVLLKEIHHRVKNNLQVITSLLTLQADSLSDETVRGMFDEACNRVRSIGEIHELLYRSPDLARIDFGAYIERLSENVQRFYAVPPERVRISIEADAKLPLSDAVPCGLIINELLTNSLKHAFPDHRSGRIAVRLQGEANRFALEVADDGVGLPRDLKIDDANSLGLKLVSVLSRQLRGDVRVDSSNGTRVSVLFPARINDQPGTE